MGAKRIPTIYACGDVLPCTAVGIKNRAKSLTRRKPLPLLRNTIGNKVKARRCTLTKLVDMQGIAEHFNIKLGVHEPKTNPEKAPQRLVYGKNQYIHGLDYINLGMLEGYCFYITKMDVLTKAEKAKLANRSSRKHVTLNSMNARVTKHQLSVKKVTMETLAISHLNG